MLGKHHTQQLHSCQPGHVANKFDKTDLVRGCYL